jgi:putative transposase
MAGTPKASWPWVRALLHSVYDQPDAASVHAQFDRVLNALTDKLPRVAEHLEAARADRWPSPPSRRRYGGRSGATTPTSGSTAKSEGAPTWSASSPTATP